MQNAQSENNAVITMNTAKFMPFQSVAPIRLLSHEFPDDPWYNGTGFFLKVDDCESIYFVTAKHCIYDNDGSIYGNLQVHLYAKCMYTIAFSECFYGIIDDNEFPEDICIYIVDTADKLQKDILLNRCLNAPTYNQVNCVLFHMINSEIKLRIIGFPHESRKYINTTTRIQPTEIPGKEVEAPATIVESSVRGVHGNLTKKKGEQYLLEHINWPNAAELSGFSGSPVIHLEPTGSGDYTPYPVGVAVMGGNGVLRFISMNVVTDLIKQHWYDKFDKILLTAKNDA